MKILIADDSEIIQERLIDLLKSIEGVSILGPCSHALEAKTITSNHEPELIITDIRMPGGGGFELVKYVHDLKLEIPIIIYSNYSFPTYLEMAKQYGIKHFFNKASDAQKLLETVQLMIKEKHESM